MRETEKDTSTENFPFLRKTKKLYVIVEDIWPY